jgi:hypothetical protein
MAAGAKVLDNNADRPNSKKTAIALVFNLKARFQLQGGSCF